MNRQLVIFIFLVPVLLLLINQVTLAAKYSDQEVTQLLESDQPPDGVVFELVSWDTNTWKWAAPKIADLRNQLLARFPDLHIAIVSHGEEQFQLTKDRQQEQSEAVNVLSGLTEDGVNLHVCGTHSSWRNIADEAYIDIVDVSPSGPAQINDYIKMGYTHIILEKP